VTRHAIQRLIDRSPKLDERIMKSIDLEPAYTETVSPKEFREYVCRNSYNIDSVRIVPPTLGSYGFGEIVVQRKSPLFRMRPDGRLSSR